MTGAHLRTLFSCSGFFGIRSRYTKPTNACARRCVRPARRPAGGDRSRSDRRAGRERRRGGRKNRKESRSMGGMTAAEKIFAAHAGKERAHAGEIVAASVDRILLHDITGPLAIDQLKAMGADRVAAPDKVVLVGDHYSPPPDPAAADLLTLMGRFAAENGIPHLFANGEGIEHTLLPERGLLRPGDLVIGTDSHTCTAGAFGALGTGMGSSDIAAAMALDELWFMVPETIRVAFTGKRRRYVTGKDFILRLLGEITVDGGTYRCLEFVGDAIAGLNLDERMALCNMAVEGGAKTCFVPPDETTRNWARATHGDAGL